MLYLKPKDIQDSIVISCVASIYVDFCREIVSDSENSINLEEYARVISKYISFGIKGVYDR